MSKAEQLLTTYFDNASKPQRKQIITQTLLFLLKNRVRSK